MQPRMPSRRTVWPITSVRASAVRTSDRCSPDANSASRRAWLMFSRFMASLLAVDERAKRTPARPRVTIAPRVRVSFIPRMVLLQVAEPARFLLGHGHGDRMLAEVRHRVAEVVEQQGGHV